MDENSSNISHNKGNISKNNNTLTDGKNQNHHERHHRNDSDKNNRDKMSKNKNNNVRHDSLRNRLIEHGRHGIKQTHIANEMIAKKVKEKIAAFYQCLEKGVLQPLKEFTVKPNEKRRLFIVWQCEQLDVKQYTIQRVEQYVNIGVRQKKTPSQENVENNNNEFMERRLQLIGNACSSSMVLAQRHIQLGILHKMEPHQNYLGIENLSEMPLLYRIKMTALTASTNISLPNGEYGIVQPYGTLQVPFIFTPRLPGIFKEMITIQNIFDRSNYKEIVVKAALQRPEKFWIEKMSLNFGQCLLHQQSRVEIISVTNVSSKTGKS